MTLNISVSQHWHDVAGEDHPLVRDVQNHLIARGYYCGPTGADGWFRASDDPTGAHSNTKAALGRFQAFNGLTKDYVCGPKTWAKLATSTTAVHPAAATNSAAACYDFIAHWLCTGLDGTRPTYRLGAEINLAGDKSPDSTDCSESIQYGVYHQIRDSWVDGSHNQYVACHGHYMTVREALHTKGSLVFRSGSSSPLGIHHVGITKGDGYTVAQARSRYGVANELSSGKAQQVGIWHDTNWQYAARIPVLR
jgi:hypothetical protein